MTKPKPKKPTKKRKITIPNWTPGMIDGVWVDQASDSVLLRVTVGQYESGVDVVLRGTKAY